MDYYLVVGFEDRDLQKPLSYECDDCRYFFWETAKGLIFQFGVLALARFGTGHRSGGISRGSRQRFLNPNGISTAGSYLLYDQTKSNPQDL